MKKSSKPKPTPKPAPKYNYRTLVILIAYLALFLLGSFLSPSYLWSFSNFAFIPKIWLVLFILITLGLLFYSPSIEKYLLKQTTKPSRWFQDYRFGIIFSIICFIIFYLFRQTVAYWGDGYMFVSKITQDKFNFLPEMKNNLDSLIMLTYRTLAYPLIKIVHLDPTQSVCLINSLFGAITVYLMWKISNLLGENIVPKIISFLLLLSSGLTVTLWGHIEIYPLIILLLSLFYYFAILTLLNSKKFLKWALLVTFLSLSYPANWGIILPLLALLHFYKGTPKYTKILFIAAFIGFLSIIIVSLACKNPLFLKWGEDIFINLASGKNYYSILSPKRLLVIFNFLSFSILGIWFTLSLMFQRGIKKIWQTNRIMKFALIAALVSIIEIFVFTFEQEGADWNLASFFSFPIVLLVSTYFSYFYKNNKQALPGILILIFFSSANLLTWASINNNKRLGANKYISTIKIGATKHLQTDGQKELQIAIALEQGGFLDEAFEKYQTNIKEFPENARNYYQVAAGFARSGDTTTALNYYSKALRANLSSASGYQKMAPVLDRMGYNVVSALYGFAGQSIQQMTDNTKKKNEYAEIMEKINKVTPYTGASQNISFPQKSTNINILKIGIIEMTVGNLDYGANVILNILPSIKDTSAIADVLKSFGMAPSIAEAIKLYNKQELASNPLGTYLLIKYFFAKQQPADAVFLSDAMFGSIPLLQLCLYFSIYDNLYKPGKLNKEFILTQLVNRAPDDPGLAGILGMHLLRTGQKDKAIPYLKNAADWCSEYHQDKNAVFWNTILTQPLPTPQ